jgi:ribonuclease HI
MDKLASISIYTDGGSRGNPGPSAYGVFIESENGEELISIGEKIGITTNNVAEYSGIKRGLVWVAENRINLKSLSKINFYMDSNLAVQQLNGIYKIKNARLREIYFGIKMLEQEIGLPIYYQHIPREKNKKADRLVNLALDDLIV